MAHVIMVIAQRNFRDEELFETKAELERAHHACAVASESPGTCVGSRGRKAVASLALETVDPAQYDAVVFVGGPGASGYFDDPAANHLARAMHRDGKLVSAICIAPTILAKAGILRGRRATAFESEVDALEAAGATYEGPGVVVDGNVVTASGPDQARAFGRALVARLDALAAQSAAE